MNVWVAKTAPAIARIHGLWERERGTDRILSLSDQTSLQPYRYNQDTDAWDTSVAVNPAALAFANESGWIPDLGVFVVCGVDGGAGAAAIRVYFYDPVANTWTAKTSSAVTSNAVLNMAGGVVPETATVHFIAGTEHLIYDANADTWGTGAARPVSAQDASAASINGLLYVYQSNVLHSYDPVADTWTARASSTATMNSPSLCALGGYLWALDGSPAFALYNPATDTWTDKATTGLAFSGQPLITGRNGRIYALGLDNLGASVLWEYEPDVAMGPDDVLHQEGWGMLI